VQESPFVVILSGHTVDLVEPKAVCSERVEHLLGDGSHPVELFAIVGSFAVGRVLLYVLD
jgi:hypothetical protein